MTMHVRPKRQRLTILSAVLAALTVASAARGIEREIAVEVQTVIGEPVAGRLISFSLRGGAVVQGNSDKRTIPAADIIRIAKRDTASPFAGVATAGMGDSESWMITLARGDVLSGRVLGSRQESVVIGTSDLGDLPVPIEALVRITSPRSASGAHQQSFQWLDRAERMEEDRVLLTNGDVLRGFISAIDADGIVVDTAGGPTKAPYRLVVAARLEHPPSPATPRPYAILTLRDGARLTAIGIECAESSCEAVLGMGATVRFGADRLVTVDMIGGRWEWLSEHRPISYEQTPMLGLGWEFLADRNVLGGPITVSGKRYERGIGVHSRSKLVFELNDAYREFVTSFAIDDDSGPSADVTVIILVDGQRRFEKTQVRRGTLFGPVRIDVTHAGRIELLVDYGDNGDLQDRFAWVEPGLIR